MPNSNDDDIATDKPVLLFRSDDGKIYEIQGDKLDSYEVKDATRVERLRNVFRRHSFRTGVSMSALKLQRVTPGDGDWPGPSGFGGSGDPGDGS